MYEMHVYACINTSAAREHYLAHSSNRRRVLGASGNNLRADCLSSIQISSESQHKSPRGAQARLSHTCKRTAFHAIHAHADFELINSPICIPYSTHAL